MQENPIKKAKITPIRRSIIIKKHPAISVTFLSPLIIVLSIIPKKALIIKITSYPLI